MLTARQVAAALGVSERQRRTLARLVARAEEVAHVELPPFPVKERRAPPSKKAKRKKRKDRALIAHHAGKRRAAKMQRTPPWADLQAIRAFYDEAARRTRETGVPHHVDHEIPLRGRLVSGLHVHNNLRVITGAENVRKHNHFEL